MLAFNRSILFGIAIPVLLTACCGSEELNQGSSDVLVTLGVSLTDSPACGFDGVNVTVNRVRVHQSGSAADNDACWKFTHEILEKDEEILIGGSSEAVSAGSNVAERRRKTQDRLMKEVIEDMVTSFSGKS